jgi:N-acetyl-alpha-D-glucosaminyl L-malate synthase BshA
MTDRKPTIAHVLHRLYLAGAEVLAADLARRLRGQYDFVFLCLDEVGPLGEQLRDEGFTVIDLHRKPGVDMSVARRLRKAVREHRIDLLHAHQYTPFFYSAASRGLLGSLRSRPPILFTEHGRHYPDVRRPKRVLANRFMLRPRDRVTAVGNFVKHALIDNEGISEDRIEVIYNGIDAARFSHSDDASLRTRVRAELAIAADTPVVLQVARFHTVKDHATAVRAFAVARQQVPGALLLLVGDGDKRDEIESLAKELGIGGAVRFLGVRKDIPRLMAASDAFMLSSVSEGVSVTLLEAMGCELPIATTNVGGNGEVVIDGDNGLLSPRGDAPSLGTNLTRLLTTPSMRQQMGAAGRARLLAMFTQQQMHQRYEQVYKQMLG